MRLSTYWTVATLALALSAQAQKMDTSANGTLNGKYFVRQVSLVVDPNTGAINRAFALYGALTFDGKGAYSFQGQLADSTTAAPAPYTVTGVYFVQSNGIAAVQSLLDNSAYIYGAVAQNVFAGSSTQSAVYTDELVAIPAGTSATATSLTGSYNFGTIEFLQAGFSARDASFTLNADGNGNIATFTLTGAAANQNSANVTQSISGATYSFTGNGMGMVNLPAGNLVQGTKLFYVSADGNFVIAGGTGSFDLMIGIRASTTAATNATFSGVYFVSGLETNAGNFDAFAGSVNGTGAGESLWHARVHSPFYGSYDNTFDVPYSFISGNIPQTSATYFFGLGGQAFLVVGAGPAYQLSLGLHAPQYTGAGVYLSPLGIVNAASLAPVTNSVAPGEFISLFGTGLAPTTAQAQSLPLSTNLAGVQVLVNGLPMSMQYVSSTQINAIVPYELDVVNASFATFQVINNGVKSNPVTVFSAGTSPGIYTLNQSGVGPAAVLHANYAAVTSASPAKAGETLQLFLTGLGVVSPMLADGAAAGGSPPSLVKGQIVVELGGQFTKASVPFAGLAPGFAGLYQVNFVVPSGLPVGNNLLTFATADGVASQTTIAISQ